jgi:hypothetical protein
MLWLAAMSNLPGHAEAILGESFDLDRSAHEAATIYLGNLHRDGHFSATKVLKGPSQLPPKFEIAQGKHWSSTYASVMEDEGEPEIIAFVGEQPRRDTARERPVSINFVAVSPPGKLFGWFPESFSMTRSRLRAHGFWNKELFLGQLEQSLAGANRLNFLLAAPPSAKRIESVLAFLKSDLPRLKAQQEVIVPAEDYGRGYLFYRTAAGLGDLSREEESFMAGLLQQAQPAEDLARLLAVVAKVRPSGLLYRSVLPLTQPDKSGVVRREAFFTLAALDPYATAGDLAHFLKLDEPELTPVLLTLSICAQAREPKLLNAAVLEPLGKLGSLLMEESRGPESNEKVNRKNSMIQLLGLYHHPSNLPLLMGGIDDEPLSPGRPTPSQFRTMSALGENPEAGGQLPGWWAKNRELLQQPYDLRSAQGIEAWLKAFDETNHNWTKGMLLRLWVFEPAIPEAKLLSACHDTNLNAAKALLAELWQQNRISADTRKILVARFLKMHIQEKPNPYPETPGWRELTVECDTDFPFPEPVSIVFTGELACGRAPVITDPRNGGGTFLASSKTRSLQSLGGAVKGPAKALIELWEMDYQTDPPKELWRLRWKLDQENNDPQSPISSAGK